MTHSIPIDILFDDAAFREYLKTDWLIKAMLHLEGARKSAGLSQKELAALLETTQSAISRAENDMDGSISLRRYAERLFACNTVPSIIETTSLETRREQYILNSTGGHRPAIEEIIEDLRTEPQSQADHGPITLGAKKNTAVLFTSGNRERQGHQVISA